MMPRDRADNERADVAAEVTAALIVIGDEILSGRTRDVNIAFIAEELTVVGIRLEEVRVVPDRAERIVATLDALRKHYDYVFTTGGIGPTHDDITADAIAAAMSVAIDVDPRAVAELQRRYTENELTPARLRMARIPQGAELIENEVSRAPGFMIGNVIVMAGVPRIMQAMLRVVLPRLRHGAPMLARTLRLACPEGDVAPLLAQAQADHPEVRMGSYPFFEEGGRLGVEIVLRAVRPDRLNAAQVALEQKLRSETIRFETVELH